MPYAQNDFLSPNWSAFDPFQFWPVFFGSDRRDDVVLETPNVFVSLLRGADHVVINAPTFSLDAGRGFDTIEVNADTGFIDLGRGRDKLEANAFVSFVEAGGGADTVVLHDGADHVSLGQGRDSLTIDTLVGHVDGGVGRDTVIFNFEAGSVDVEVDGDQFVFTDRFSGEEMVVEAVERFEFSDATYTAESLRDAFDGPLPYIQVGGGTQVLTINDPDPTISVIWDRVVQQAVIDTSEPAGPTIASRAYAMMHTAMYDAWSAYDATAVQVSFDAEGDNIETTGSDADKEKAMSFAAITVLRNLFPDQEELFASVMSERLGYTLEDDGSVAAEIGIDAAEDLLALRADDGSNQAGGYADTTDYTPANAGPEEVLDITRWTPENVPIDPEDPPAEQSFLTPQWELVESFAILEDATGETDFSDVRPVAPEPFFTDAFEGSVLDIADGTITLVADGTIGGVAVSSGDVIHVSRDLIGEVINPDFIDQALDVIDYSANLNDEGKIIAEFWEDGGGTAFPPGTFMAFAQFVSARDDHSVDQDAQLFLAMSNAVMDAGIATWEAKVFYDYARPVRVIRDLGELELIGTPGVDENTGETGYVIEAFGGFNEDGTGRGTQTILAENFVTFQRPETDPSPPFSEYTSGHSGFSAAGAEVLRLFTGSDDFGGAVTFAPGSTQFESGVPLDETTLAWDTFSEAADEAGLSRLFGGIHFEQGDVNGRALGAQVGQDAFDLAMAFVNGTATDADRPFYEFIV